MINLESLLSGFAGNLNPAVAGSISVVIGLLALLFGYRLFRAYLFVVGFAVGTIAASAGGNTYKQFVNLENLEQLI